MQYRERGRERGRERRESEREGGREGRRGGRQWAGRDAVGREGEKESATCKAREKDHQINI